MAITQHQQPSEFSPAYNEMVFVIASTNSGQTNFRYLFDVYEGTGTTRLARLKIPAEPDSGFALGVCDVSRIIQDYVSHDLPTLTGAFSQNGSSYKSYMVKYGEEYGTTPSAYASLLNSSKRFAYNAALPWLDFPDYAQADYLIASGSTKPFLSNAPTTQEIFLDQLGWLNFMTASSGAASLMRVKRYNSAGTLLDSTDVDNSNDPHNEDNDKFLRFPAGTKNLDTLLTAAPYSLGSMSASGVASYTLQLYDSGNAASSELRTFTIESNCSKYTNYRLHWLNTLGGWDAFNFTLLSRKNVGIEREEYKKSSGSLSGTAWSYAKNERGRTQFETRVKESISLTSNWLSDDEMEWLRELLESPQVYWEKDSSTLVAVMLDVSSYEVKKKVNDKLILVEFSMSMAHDNIKQRG